MDFIVCLAEIRLDLTNFKDNLDFKENGSVPDTAAFIHKMEGEIRKAEHYVAIGSD